jgi:pyrimidine-nucleoside phosphorylase
MAALLMAIYFRGLTDREGRDFLSAMIDSGVRLDLASIPGIKVDKHSTGGVGDKTSLIVAPIVAAAGVPVPMISGRALGHTGGTLDKLESIPGFRVHLTHQEFIAVLAKTGCAFGAQTDEIVPADRKLYALRDVTSTVAIPPLIAASILSKKIAEGTNALVMDVKIGSGGFLKDEQTARGLATMLVSWSAHENVKTIVYGTDMERPLGRTAGNAPEVRECLDILRTGTGDARLLELSRVLAATMLMLGEKAATMEAARRQFDDILASGAGYRKMCDICVAQGAALDVVENFATCVRAKHSAPILARASGFIRQINPREIGLALVELGAGREKSSDSVDHTAGITLAKDSGDYVQQDEVLADIHWSGRAEASAAIARFHSAFTIGDEAPLDTPLIRFRCDQNGFHPAPNPY